MSILGALGVSGYFKDGFISVFVSFFLQLLAFTDLRVIRECFEHND